jgi:L-ascorbate metabolism protein UlaG (beta-lactamase superfamily)
MGNTPAMTESSKTTCTWLGTAGWIIRHGSTTIVSDAYLSRPPGVTPFPVSEERLAEADAVLCTHGHFDHAFDMERVARLSGAPVWAPGVVCERLRSGGIDPGRLHPNETADATRVGNVGLEVVASKHIRYDLPLAATTIKAAVLGGTFWELVDLGLGWPMGSNSDYLLYAGDHTIYLSGSLGQSPARMREHRPDVALLPYNGRTDMDRVSAVAAENLRPRLMVFHHWDDFYPDFAPPQAPDLALPALRRRFGHIRFHVAQLAEPLDLDALLG